MAYDIKKLRQQVKAAKGGFQPDPLEFRPPKVQKNDPSLNYRLFVLPPLEKGDKCLGGTASQSMNGVFFIRYGLHWVNSRPHACPRVWDESPCDMCDTGFNLLSEIPKTEANKDARSKIVKTWLSQMSFAVNVYFLPADPNPEDVRGKVRYYSAPRSCFDQWEAALNRDDGGDVADPQAFGVFYDEVAAFLYQLSVTHKSGYNTYGTSKFLSQLGPIPIVMNKNKEPNTAMIEAVLAQRIDLFTKIPKPDPDNIRKMTAMLLDGGDNDAPATDHDTVMIPTTDDLSGEVALPTIEETVAPAPAAVKKPAATKKQPAPVSAPTPEPVAAAADIDSDTSEIDEILAKLNQ